MLDDELADRAVCLVPFSRKHDLYFADAELVLRQGSETRVLGASSLAFGATVAAERCKSELLERWAQHAWERAGRPPLDQVGMRSGQPLGRDAPSAPGRPDATGTCAGPVGRRADVLEHGLLEVLERDAVTRLLDDGEGTLRETSAEVPVGLDRVGRRAGGTFELWVVDRPRMPPTSVALFSVGDEAGAIGSACRLDEQAAGAHAAAEALMVFTTARHWARRDDVPASCAGVVWASTHIGELRDELRARVTTAAGAPREPVGPAVDAAASWFGAEPRYCELPLAGAALARRAVWRVSVPGARSPAQVGRSPWPLG